MTSDTDMTNDDDMNSDTDRSTDILTRLGYKLRPGASMVWLLHVITSKDLLEPDGLHETVTVGQPSTATKTAAVQGLLQEACSPGAQQ